MKASGVGWLCVSVFALTPSLGCGKDVDRCHGDVDCTNPMYPFCDLDGMVSGLTNVCTIHPQVCPVLRCGCTPGVATCSDDTLVTCNEDGKSQSTTACAAGCSDDGTSCKTFDVPNGLAPALASSSGHPGIVFPTSVTINTDSGGIVDSTNASVTVASTIVMSGDTQLRVFSADSFVIHNARIVGGRPVAFVAHGPIEIHGLVDVSADSTAAGPGAAEPPIDSCGESGTHGAAGGANATRGGAAKYTDLNGVVTMYSSGVVDVSFEPLRGGGRGGSLLDSSNQSTHGGGGGGGAIELVSASQIVVAETGTIDVGGGGGSPTSGGGGGAGGTMLLVAPAITIAGTLAANGGSGSACGVSVDATPDDIPAASDGTKGCGAQAGGQARGAGGTLAVAAEDGSGYKSEPSGGGGGGVGAARISTLDGSYARASGALVSVVVETSTLQVH